MSCTLNTIKEKAYELEPRAKTDSLGVYIPYNYNLSENQRFTDARRAAIKLINNLNKEFKAESFSKVASLNTTYTNGVGVNITVPKRLDNVYQLKKGLISSEELKNKNEKLKLDFSEEDAISQEQFDTDLKFIDISNELLDEVSGDLTEEEISEAALKYQENRDDYLDGLFSPSFQQNSSQTNSNPVNFREWKDIRMEELDNLRAMKKNLLKLKSSDIRKNKISKINSLIKDIEEELGQFDEKDPFVVHDQIVNEINNLNNILNMPKDDFKELSLLFENNRVRERILKLEEVINDDVLDDESSLYYNLMRGLNKDKVNLLRLEVNDLKENYIKNINTIIKSIIKNQETIQYESNTKSDDYKKRFDELIDKLINLEKGNTRDFAGETFLSASMYDSVFSDLLSLVRNNNQIVEENRTAPLKDKLRNSFLKIKNIKINGKTIQDIIFAKDEFGVKQSRIITPFSKRYYSNIRTIKSSISNFLTSNYLKDTDRGEKYKTMQQTLKSHVDFIQPYKIKSVVEKYKNSEDFNSHFKYSEQEMNNYEKEMREKMGDIAFDKYLKNIVGKLETFLEDAPQNPIYRYHQNPMNFISHFYSDNFLKEDQTTGDFILPKYINFIPSLNKKSYYNSEFREIEKHFKNSNNDEHFKDFYNSLSDSLEYINETIPNAKINSVINIEENSIIEVIKQLNYHKNVPKNLLKILKMYYGKYISGNYYKGKTEYRGKNEARKFNYGYSEYGSSDIRNLMFIYSNKTTNELINIAKNEGLIIPDDFNPKDKYKRKLLINSMITHEINKTSSTDLFKRLNHALNIAESANTRLNTKTITTFIKDYLKQKDNAERHLNYLKIWEAQVLDEVGYLDNGEGNRSKVQKFERKKVKIFKKKLTGSEKRIKELLQGEKKNIKNPTDFKINSDGIETVYKKQGNSYYKIIGESKKEISKIDMQNAYISYIDNKIKSLGKNMTMGSLIEGLRMNILKASLTLRPVTQIINRAAGYMQNNADAATGLYGFTMKEQVEARKLLFLASATKIEDYTKETWSKLSLPDRKRIQQQRILISFLKNHNLIDNSYNEFTSSDNTREKVNNIIKNLVSDFTTNIAEFHNQAELLVAMMQKEMIEKINPDGSISMIPFYDPKTKMFPYDPETMELLPQHQTAQNIENLASNDSPFLKNLILKYKDRRNRLNGAYDRAEKISLDQSASGKALTIMLRWWFSNTNNEWGTKNVNLSNMEMNVKGRKIVLLEHFPVLATHKIFLSGLQIVSGVGIATVVGIGSTLGVVGGGLISGYAIYKLAKSYKKSSYLSKKDFMLAANYATEVSLRTINSLVQFTGRRSKYIDNKIDKKIANASDRLGITEKDRKLMSASAEQVALAMKLHFSFLLGGLATSALLILMSGDDDDDEIRYKKLKDIDGRMKFIINTRNTLLNDINQYTSPDAFINVLDSKIFYSTIKRSINYIVDSPKKYEEGKISESEMYRSMTTGVAGPFLGVPSILYTDKLKFQNKRVYDNSMKTPYDDLLLNYHLSGEPLYKKKLKQARNKARIKLTEMYTKRVRKEFEEQNRNDYYNIEDIVKKNVNRVFKSTYIKRFGNSNEKAYKSINFDELIEKNKNKRIRLR